MKNTLLLISIFLLIANSYSQENKLESIGNVGIGTTTPSQKLDIVTQNEGVNYLMHLGGKTHLSGNAFGIGFNPEGWHRSYGNRIKTAIVVEGDNTGWSRGNLHILQNNKQDNTAATLDDSVLTISPIGNIGIGTKKPNMLLDLKAKTGPSRVRLQSNSNQSSFITFMPDEGAQNQYNIGYNNANDIFSITGGSFPDTSGIHLKQNGNVGIGTTNPDMLLDLKAKSGPSRLRLQSNSNQSSFITFMPDEGAQNQYNIGYNNTNDIFSITGGNFPDARGIHLKQNGNVGIGTTTPSQKLDIVTQNEGVNYLMHLGGKTHLSGNAFGIGFNPEGWHSSYGNRIKTAIVVEGDNTGWSRGNLHILQNNKQDNTAATLDDSVLTISPIGNIGIGTKKPNMLLDLKAKTGPSRVRLQSNSNQSSFITFMPDDGAQNQYNIGYNDSNDIFSITGGSFPDSRGIHLKQNGNVGIGTFKADSELTVAGNIHSREVKVTINAGADFVFENDYNLPSLKKVETYIKEQKHLPEIASAKEMETNGIKLAEMNIKLLQKIEELTLYTIEQEKKITKQSDDIADLKRLFKKLIEYKK